MLQVARLAPTQLGESRDLVAAFLRAHLNPDGGFQNRTGASDLYYTVFGLDGLIALQETLPVESSAAYLDRFADRRRARFRARGLPRPRLGRAPSLDPIQARIQHGLLDRIEIVPQRRWWIRHRTGCAVTAAAYAAFLALGAYQDLGRTLPRRAQHPHVRFGGSAPPTAVTPISPGLPSGITTATAAADHGDATSRRAARPRGRHVAAGSVPQERRVFRGAGSTRARSPVDGDSAARAVGGGRTRSTGVREPCLDFVDSLWTNRGGFFGTWADDAADCEYTFYALLALGHLSLDST